MCHSTFMLGVHELSKYNKLYYRKKKILPSQILTIFSKRIYHGNYLIYEAKSSQQILYIIRLCTITFLRLNDPAPVYSNMRCHECKYSFCLTSYKVTIWYEQLSSLTHPQFFQDTQICSFWQVVGYMQTQHCFIL